MFDKEAPQGCGPHPMRVLVPDPLYPAWLPTPAEIKERATICRWLREHGFVEPLTTAIMIYESPHIDLVVKFVAKYGDSEARERLERFL